MCWDFLSQVILVKLQEQMSLLVKHQKISKPVFHVGVGPTFQPSLGDESFERQEEACGCGEDVCDNFPAFRTLHSQTKPINGLVRVIILSF